MICFLVQGATSPAIPNVGSRNKGKRIPEKRDSMDCQRAYLETWCRTGHRLGIPNNDLIPTRQGQIHICMARAKMACQVYSFCKSFRTNDLQMNKLDFHLAWQTWHAETLQTLQGLIARFAGYFAGCSYEQRLGLNVHTFTPVTPPVIVSCHTMRRVNGSWRDLVMSSVYSVFTL